jgi:hypothetical protein
MWDSNCWAIARYTLTVHLLLKPLLLLTLGFAACIGLIYALPYDDSDLLTFLTPPEDCPMPCFMGIRPGVTTLEEAGSILVRHSWVRNIRQFYNSRTGEITMIQWTWSGSQPGLIDASKPAYIYGDVTHTILSLNIETVIPFGDLWLGWGRPDWGVLEGATGLLGVMIQNAGYINDSFSVRSEFSCPVRRYQVFQTPVTISFVSRMVFPGGGDDDYIVSDWATIRLCPVN